MRKTILACALSGLLLSSVVARGQIAPVEGSQAMVGAKGIQVPPVQRTEVGNMIDAGTIDAEGFTHLTVNLAAEMKGPAAHAGVVAAILIPDIAPFDLAYKTLGLLPASLEQAAAVTPQGGIYCMAKQQTLEIGFPRYRVLLYNTSGSAATVAFFAYRSRR